MARQHIPAKGQTAAWAAALRAAAMAVETRGPAKGRKRIDLIAERLVEMALHGEGAAAVSAIRELADRLDGKSPPARYPSDDEPTHVVYSWASTPGE